MNFKDYQQNQNASLAQIARCSIKHKEIATWKPEFGARQWTTHRSRRVIEDAGALRSGLCDLISSLTKVDYWQTDRSTKTHTHTESLLYTYQSVINIQAYLWHWKQGHGLETFTQHATSNPKQTRELDEEGGGESESEKEKTDWLGICLKEKG